MRALEVFDAPVVVAGGNDKKLDLAPFARALAERAGGVVLLGDTADALERLLRAAGAARIARAGDMAEAVERGLALAGGRGVLLLSPGHASYGMFTNYEERGDRFRAAVTGRRT